jgi:DME family drug/metabolite transporter
MSQQHPSDAAARVRRLTVHTHRGGLAAIAVAALLWGTTGVVSQRLGVAGLGPVGVGFLRLAVAAGALLLMARGLRPLAAAARAAPGGLLLVGAGVAGYQALYFVAVAEVGVGVATVGCLGTAPVLMTAWEAVRARRSPAPGVAVALLAAVAGLVLVSATSGGAPSASPGSGSQVGLALAVAAGAVYAASTGAGAVVGRRVGARALTTVSTAVGAVALAPLAVLEGTPVPHDPAAIAALLYLGVVTTAVAYGLFYAGLRTTKGSVAATVTLLEPLTAAGLGVVLLGEASSPGTLAGGALLLGGVALLARQAPQVAPASPAGGPAASPPGPR